jgi:cholesterol transport system auxiliary component
VRFRTTGQTTGALIALALSTAACVNIGGGKPPVSLLTLTSLASLAANDMRSAKAGEPITIDVPGVPMAIANTRVAVSDGPVAIAYVKDAVWVEPPARLFQRILSETVAAKTGKVVLDPRQFAVDPGIKLSGQLKSFGIDAAAGQAVIIYDAVITRDKGKSVNTKRFEARRPVAVVTAASSGTALNAAANEIAAEVATWVAGG